MKNTYHHQANILSVSDLTGQISSIIESSFYFIWVEGEISNLRIPSSGHSYFTLKDNNSQIRAVLFRQQKQNIQFSLTNGQKLICFGKLTVYSKRGEYQIILDYAEPTGIGSLHLAFEQLRKKIERLGLFDEGKKQPIPFFPKKIGIVTSPTGAAIKDILQVLERRNAGVNVLLAPVKVQGDDAAVEIAEAIRLLNRSGEIDSIIVGRGGGSIEDLWAFNEENVAFAIYNSKAPVISAIGHERDFTIADYVADIRAPTPSAAAEIVSKSSQEISTELAHFNSRLTSSFLSKISVLKGKLGYEISLLKNPVKKLAEQRLRIDELLWRVEKIMAGKIVNLRFSLRGMSGKLNSLSPLAILERGYSITTSITSGQVIKTNNQVKKDDLLNIKLHKGQLVCIVKKQ